MPRHLTSDEKLESLKNKYDPEIEGVPNIHRSTEKFDSITQEEIDKAKAKVRQRVGMPDVLDGM